MKNAVRNYKTFYHKLGEVYHGHEFRKSFLVINCHAIQKHLDPENHLHQYDPSTILELLSSNFGTLQQKDNNNLTVYLGSGLEETFTLLRNM